MDNLGLRLNPFQGEENALSVFEKRSSVLTRNLANASTPNYKAKDINFREALQQSVESTNPLLNSHANHIQPKSFNGPPKEYFRVPMESGQDGNTVDDELEKTKFVENALYYQASLSFLQNKKSNLLKAIKGD